MQSTGSALKEVSHLRFIGPRGLKITWNWMLFRALHDRVQSPFTRFKMQLLIWLTETETGDSKIGQLYRYQHFLPELVHDGKLSKKKFICYRGFWNEKRPRPVAFSWLIMPIYHCSRQSRVCWQPFGKGWSSKNASPWKLGPAGLSPWGT